MNVHVHVFDLARRFDPTGTTDIRSRFRREMDARWQRLKQLASQTIIEQDLLGLNQIGAHDPVRQFQGFIDNALARAVTGNDGSWTQHYLDEAAARARSRAYRLVPATLRARPETNHPVVTSIAAVELQGVAEAVSQQTTRAVAAGLLAKDRPRQIAARVADRINAVGRVRARALVELTVNAAFNGATLDTFKSLGITKVGVQAEHVVRKPKAEIARMATGRDDNQCHDPHTGEFCAGGGGGVTGRFQTQISSTGRLISPSDRLGRRWHAGDPRDYFANREQVFKRLRPAIRLLRGDDQLLIGKRGDYHRHIAESYGIPGISSTPEWDEPVRGGTITYERGFVDSRTRAYYKADSLDVDAADLRYNTLTPTSLVRGLREMRADAKKKKAADAVGTGPGSRTGREEPPSRSTIARIEKAAAGVEELETVEVLTAGDDDVCLECQDISEMGPYEIDEARSLIPAHPNCRCAFVPFFDDRFADVEE